MEDYVPPPIPECSFLEEKYGIKVYGLKKTLLFYYEPKIKIICIGIENDLETRNIILMGASGAGKTSLINALVNHLFNVKFENNYRYVLKDEIGNKQKTKAESQTEYVVGYLIYAHPGSGRTHNYLIIDTPGFKDSRGQQQEKEVIQQIRTFLQDVDGVDELHCIGFVINGTVARIQDQFRDVVRDFCEVFGENAKENIRVFISFGHMKKPPVLDVLDCSCLKDYKRYKFDNVSLIACNHPSEEYSEEEIGVSKAFWNVTTRIYDLFFSEVNSVNAVDLGMTRETLNNVKFLHKSTDEMKKAVESYLSVILDLKRLEDKCREYQYVMKLNENWKTTMEIKKKWTPDPINVLGLIPVGLHAHNCKTCDQTCKYPCLNLIRKECPKPDKACDKCSCPNNTHVKSKDVIMNEKEILEVIHEDKKASYEGAKRKESLALEQMKNGTDCLSDEISKLIKITQEMIKHLEKVNESSLRSDHPSPQEYIKQILTEIRIESLGQSTYQEQQGHVIQILEDLKDHLSSLDQPSKPWPFPGHWGSPPMQVLCASNESTEVSMPMQVPSKSHVPTEVHLLKFLKDLLK